MDSNSIAIIGMSGRFPGAASVDVFWQNLIAGIDSISDFTAEELAGSGLDVSSVKNDPNFVTSRGILDKAEWLDAAFFGIGAKEAEITDPQQRLFLEAAWEAFEHAGYDPERIKGYAGVYAGVASNSYYLSNVHSNSEILKLVGRIAILVGNEKDHLATRVAYKLNLKGPAISISTACSTSLVAVCQACQALLFYQCDIALAGGVAVRFPQKRGYHYQEGAMFSRDGHCFPFDAKATGTNFSDGLGIVVLKRLEDAVNDGDQIYAVIKGFGINNDGAAKVGFAAPSVDGQAEVITLAMAQAGFKPSSISYIEAHGTATPLGDPIEIAGLTKAFKSGTPQKNYCAIGSVKGNIGHLDSAAGVAGLIKTALALKHKTLPASLHFEKPNPKIDFANSPFFVNHKLTEWKAGPTPRRAGVSSFGVGGTNAHVVLEESPATTPSGPSRPWQLLLLSAKTAPALEGASTNLLAHLKANPDLNLADAAYTLQTGRAVFQQRRLLVCQDVADAIKALEPVDPKRVVTQATTGKGRPVVFLFSGQGAQYVNMGAELYRSEGVFKEAVDRCAKILLPHLGQDLRQVLFPPAGQEAVAEEQLLQTRITQPALFVFEYALTKLWQSWGVVPAAMLGHSVGSIVAACVAGVFSLEDALAFVARRAELVQAQPKGAMLAVRLPEKEVLALLNPELSIAAINSPSLCVVSGPFEAIAGLEGRLKEQGVAARRLHTSHAFHSAMMDAVLAPLAEFLAGIKLGKPVIPFIADVTGRWITEAEATDAKYWVKHVREAVRFADGVGEVLKNPEYILLEVGPGQTLSPLTNQHPGKMAGHLIMSSFSATKEHELAALLNALGRLWLAGQTVDWAAFYKGEKRRRIPLPTYAFQRERFWVEPVRSTDGATGDKKHQPALPAFGSGPDEASGPSPKSRSEAKTPGATENLAEANAVISRQKQILSILKAQFEELSGVTLKAADISFSFLEMGFDSLLLVQAGQLITKRFGVPIAFRQLMQELTTLNQLADFLDRALPAEALPAAATPTAVANRLVETPHSLPVPDSLDAIQAQIQVLTRQLESLRQAQAQQSANGHPIAIATEANSGIHPSSGTSLAPPASEATEVLTVPLSEPQMELWLASSLDREASCAYNQTFSIHLRNSVSIPALRQTLQELVNRHDALRTIFLPDGSGQQIHPQLKLDVPLNDLSMLTASERERQLDEALQREDSTPFDLAKGPLFRAQILKLSKTHHVLITCAHHIVLDGWSIGVILREFSELYTALVSGNGPKLKPALQYRDYLQWLATPESLARIAKSEAYWLGQFARLPEAIDLPVDRSRPAVKTYRSGNQSLFLGPQLYQALKKAAATQGCTLFSILLTSLKTLLFRLTGKGDLVVGFPTAGQPLIDGQSKDGRWLVGHCVSFLPICSHCDGNMLFSDYLQQVQRLTLDAREHYACTFGNLVKQLRVPPDAGQTPLVHLLFNLSGVGQNLTLPESEVIFPKKHFDFFDLSFNMNDTRADLRVQCLFNSYIFNADTVERWLGHWRLLLEEMIKNPQRPLSELPMLRETERQQLLVGLNRTEVAHPKNKCLHELIAEQAGRKPEATAIVFQDQRLTYRQLDERSNQLGHYLQKRGVGPDTLVGLCVDRSLEMVIGLLGILKAGGAYVPMDPGYPKERLAYMLEDAQPKVLLTQQHLMEQLPVHSAQVVKLDADWPDISGQAVTPVQSQVTPKNLANVIYTSGSTGNPKGVAIEHRSSVSFATWARQVFTDEEFDGVLFATSMCFDLSVFEFFVTLANGGKVILAKNALELPYLPAANEVRMINTVPSAIAELVRTGKIPQSVITVNLAGEALPQSLVDKIYENRFIKKVYDLYGPTETTTYSTFTLRQSGGKATIGRPIANTQIYILDRNRQPTPIGVPGELYIGGIGVAREYHRRPELTAEKFVANPFQAGERMYRTGDLARYLSDGNIEYLGRLDHQVKIRGFRIELGEIEAQLTTHSSINEVAVIAREDTVGDKRLVAYLTLKNGKSPKTEELRELLLKKLPEYMVPSAFVTLEQFPRTPNGKLDRKALPRPEFEAKAETFALPRTPRELTLAKIWGEVLGIKQIGLHDNFFELGGHSLLAVQLQMRLEKELGKNVPLTAIFQAPTVAKMTEFVGGGDATIQRTCVLVPPSATSRSPVFFFHFFHPAQQLARHLLPDQPVYVIESTYEEELRLWHEKKQNTLTLEELAARSVTEIRRFQPEGPYHLAGFCFGGILAYEVASQLAQQGQDVATLTLLDSFYRPGFVHHGSSRTRRWLFHAQGLWQHRLDYLSMKFRKHSDVAETHSPHLDAIRGETEGRWQAEMAETRLLHDDFMNELTRIYEAKPYHGKAILIRAISAPHHFNYSSANGWNKVLTNNFAVEDILCDHFTLLEEPHVREVAKKLQHFISSHEASKNFGR